LFTARFTNAEQGKKMEKYFKQGKPFPWCEWKEEIHG
jgi:hypothetical protein